MTNLAHWAEKYVGLPCGPNEDFDCADLALLIQREEFNRFIQGPNEHLYRGHQGHMKYRLMQEQIKSLLHKYVASTDSPREGDPVLMTTRGYTQHIGVFCKIQGEVWILHAVDAAEQVVLQRRNGLDIRGLKIEGYYRWL